MRRDASFDFSVEGYLFGNILKKIVVVLLSIIYTVADIFLRK